MILGVPAKANIVLLAKHVNISEKTGRASDRNARNLTRILEDLRSWFVRRFSCRDLHADRGFDGGDATSRFPPEARDRGSI